MANLLLWCVLVLLPVTCLAQAQDFIEDEENYCDDNCWENGRFCVKNNPKAYTECYEETRLKRICDGENVWHPDEQDCVPPSADIPPCECGDAKEDDGYPPETFPEVDVTIREPEFIPSSTERPIPVTAPLTSTLSWVFPAAQPSATDTHSVTAPLWSESPGEYRDDEEPDYDYETSTPPPFNVTSLAAMSVIDTRCLACICQRESGCNSAIGCRDGFCGPYQLSHRFYRDCGINGGGYEACTNSTSCSELCIKNYLKLHSLPCIRNLQDLGSNKTVPTCEDHVRIFHGGPNGCKVEYTEIFWEKIRLCYNAPEEEGPFKDETADGDWPGDTYDRSEVNDSATSGRLFRGWKWN